MTYLVRTADRVLDELLGGLGAVLIEGPRGCGKTSTALEHAASSVRMDRSPEMVALADLNPVEVLRGASPRLIDEWQLAPSLWNAIRHEVDDRRQRGQFILSGSATPADDITRHSGAGRFARLRMRPMSLSESQHSSGEVSLSGLAHATTVSGTSPLTYDALASLAVRGGWPALLGATDRHAAVFSGAYLDDLCRTDVPFAVGVRHDADRLRRLVGSLARNVASEATLAAIARDVSGAGPPVDVKTIAAYMDALRRVFALDELPAWSVALRSRSRLRTQPKLHLCDPSLALAALGVGPARLARDPAYFGQVFESMVVRDLRCLAGAEFGNVYHYRDNTGLEVDAIIEYPSGAWGAAEVKLGSAHLAQAERSLLTLRDERVDADRTGPAAFLAIITGTQYAYTLPSGVHVIPLGTLGP